MTKKQFLERLENELFENNVTNIEDILVEYENHFAEGKKIGKSEKEICESLGSPEMIAADYKGYKSEKKKKVSVKKSKKWIKILIASICSAYLLVVLAAVIYVASGKHDDRTVTLNYKAQQVSLQSFKDGDTNDFRYLSEDFVVDEWETFYLIIEPKSGCVVKSVKIDGVDKTDTILSAYSGSKLNLVSEDVREVILSHANCLFIEVTVIGDTNIEIISEKV